MPGQVYAVASGKGGVGKTTTAVNLGVTLRADGHSVVLVDADLGMANLADFLGIEPAGTIHDVLAGSAGVDDVVTAIAEGFAVIPGDRALTGFAHADPDALAGVIEAAAAEYDYVIVDTGAGLSYEDVLPLALVDDVILVTTPDPAAVGDTAKTVELAGLVDGAIAGVVVTRVRDGDDPEAIADRLGVDLLAAIPFDVAVQESTAAGSPLEAHAPTSPPASAYRGLEATLTDGEPPTGDTTPGAVEVDDAPEPDAGSGAANEAAGDPSAPTEESADVVSDTETDPATDDEADPIDARPDHAPEHDQDGADSTPAVAEDPDDAPTDGEPATGGDTEAPEDAVRDRDTDAGATSEPTTDDDTPDTESHTDSTDEESDAATPDSDTADTGRNGPLARILGWLR